MTARDGNAVSILTCSKECTVSSRDSRINASESPPAKPTASDIRRFRGMLGVEGDVGADAGSTIRTLLDRNPVMTPASFSFCKRPS
jgi:hypothetical protein